MHILEQQLIELGLQNDSFGFAAYSMYSEPLRFYAKVIYNRSIEIIPERLGNTMDRIGYKAKD